MWFKVCAVVFIPIGVYLTLAPGRFVAWARQWFEASSIPESMRFLFRWQLSRPYVQFAGVVVVLCSVYVLLAVSEVALPTHE